MLSNMLSSLWNSSMTFGAMFRIPCRRHTAGRWKSEILGTWKDLLSAVLPWGRSFLSKRPETFGTEILSLGALLRHRTCYESQENCPHRNRLHHHADAALRLHGAVGR